MSMRLRKVSYPLGAEVLGVDISKPLDGETLRSIHKAFLDHCLLLFRGVPLGSAQFVAFSRHFGQADANRKTCDPEYPELTRIVNTPKPAGVAVDTHYAGSDWHSDASFKVAPTSITMLHAVEVPDVGGDTQFANMYLAYETL